MSYWTYTWMNKRISEWMSKRIGKVGGWVGG